MSQPESRLQRKIQDELKRHRAFVFKVHGSEHTMAGLPDLVVCYRGYFIGIEVKMPGNKLSKIQQRRHQEIERAGGFICVAHGVPDAMQALFAIDAFIEASGVSDRPSERGDMLSTQQQHPQE